jgi:molybdate/tungstate transport system ATP-binding protein
MIRVQNLSVKAGTFSLDGVSFQISTGDYVVLIGKTGCGKTTLWEAICGLRPIVSGSISLMNKDVTYLKPAERGIGYVPQDGALFTNMTVRENLGFALMIREEKPELIKDRVNELASLLGLEKLLDRNPIGLSGGEAQRVALGRALANHPDILCLDEPLSALDDDTREDMYRLFKIVRERTKVTVLHITHNMSEARRLADKVFELKNKVMTEIPLAEFNKESSK